MAFCPPSERRPLFDLGSAWSRGGAREMGDVELLLLPEAESLPGYQDSRWTGMLHALRSPAFLGRPCSLPETRTGPTEVAASGAGTRLRIAGRSPR